MCVATLMNVAVHSPSTLLSSVHSATGLAEFGLTQRKSRGLRKKAYSREGNVKLTTTEDVVLGTLRSP